MAAKPKIFISYSSKEPDASIATRFNDQLQRAGMETFFAPANIKIGQDWAESISKEIRSFDYFLVLLSENSVSSDMVAEEIRRAVEYFYQAEKKPGILPVRIKLDFKKSINYDIDSYLRKFQQRLWNEEKDTTIILGEILDVINAKNNNATNNGEASKVEIDFVPTGCEPVPRPNAPIVFSGGRVENNCPYYVVRKEEKDNVNYVKSPGALIRIFAPRQYGKTSLLARINKLAQDNNHLVIPINFQLDLVESQLQDLDKLACQICVLAGEAIGIKYRDFKSTLNDIWDSPNNPLIKMREFFEDFVLTKTDKDIVFAIDEADRLFKYDNVSADFFGMLRAWHEEAIDSSSLQRIKIIVVHSTEAYLATTNVNQSPFANVGCQINLNEFNSNEISDLSQKYQLRFSSDNIKSLYTLIGGHPYLVRKAFSHLYNGMAVDELLNQASSDNGPFGDHLKRIYHIIYEKQELFNCFKCILLNQKTGDNITAYKLKAAGLVDGNIPDLKVKFTLYRDYFKNKL